MTDSYQYSVFLAELLTQIHMAKLAIDRLREGNRLFRGDTTSEENRVRGSDPFEQKRSIHSLLTHCGIIARFLFVGDRKGKWKKLAEPRCSRLRELLEIEELPNLEKLSIRNDLEHIDERMDEIFAKEWDGRSEISFEPIKIKFESATKPSGNQRQNFVLASFDYETDEVGYRDETVRLSDLKSELDRVSNAINPAIAKVNPRHSEG